MLDEEMYIAY